MRSHWFEEFAVVVDRLVRNIALARVAILNKEITHRNVPTVLASDVGSGHPFNELYSREREATFDMSGTGHAFGPTIVNGPSEAPKPTLSQIQSKWYRRAAGEVVRRIVAVCATLHASDFRELVHLPLMLTPEPKPFPYSDPESVTVTNSKPAKKDRA